MSGYTHNKGFSSIDNGYAVGKKGSEVVVIDPTGLAKKVPMVYHVTVADLAAGADLAASVFARIPAGHSFEITDVQVLALADAAGIDASNTCKIDLYNGASIAATKTFTDAVTFPTAMTGAALTIDTDHDTVLANGYLFCAVTNGATADPPSLYFKYTAY